MKQSSDMDKNKKVWIGVISLGMALLLFAVLMMIQQSMLKEPEKEWVICAKQEIPDKVILTEANVAVYTERRQIPVMWLPEDYISEEKQLYGMISETNIAKDSILNQAVFSVYDKYYEDYQEISWISVPVQELYEGVAGSLRTGDYIDIYLLREEDGGYHCEMLQEKVPIAGAFSSQGTVIPEGSKEGLCQLIVIPIEKENTAQFYEKLAQGNIRIAKYETA